MCKARSSVQFSFESIQLTVKLTAFVVAGWMTWASSDASAATIDKAKGNSAIIIYDEGEAIPKAGDKLFALEGGKRKAILEVKEIKGKRAKVSVRKGKALPGMEVQAAPQRAAPPSDGTAQNAGTAPTEPAAENNPDAKPKRKKKQKPAESVPQELATKALFEEMTAGATASYAMNNQIVALPTGNTNMSGSGFGLRAFVDVPVVEWLSLLGRGGIEQFNVQASNVVGSTAGKTEIMYAVGDLLAKAQFDYGAFRPFVLGGLGLHFPVSKSSNVLSVNAISATTVFIFGGGFNYAISSDMYLHFTAEYGMFPPSNEVTTSTIAARVGLGFAL